MAALFQRVALLCALAAVLTASSAQAQSGYSSFGRRFIVAFPDTTQSQVRLLYNTLEPAVTLSLFSLDSARVTISAPGYLRTVTVRADRSTTVTLTDPAMRASKIFVDSVNTPLPTTFELRSDRPIAVTAYFTTIHGTEAFTPLPVEQWGQEYYAASLNQWFVYNALQIEEKYTFVAAPAALLVVASEDNTDVTVETATPIVGGSPRTVTLNAGQVYLVETAVPARLDSLAIPDLSGARITASKPVGVISGNTRTMGSTDNPIPLDPLPTNAMSNTAFEWLHPVTDHGHTFIYRQFSAVDELATTELVRVYGTSPGTTTVTTTNGGPPMSLQQGSFLEFSSKAWRPGNALQPFAVRTDKPAEAFVVTASSAQLIGNDPSTGIEMETTTWSPAMVELVPRERWLTLGRYNAPVYPGGISHYLVLAADSGTTLLLDDATVQWDSLPITGTSYRHARVQVVSGDHTLRAIGGRFTASAFGQRRGYAAFRPFRANDPDDPDAGVAAHPTYYLEILAIAYAMPVPGLSDFTPAPDSVEISRIDRCDSTVVVANRLGATWSSSIIEAHLDAGSRNVAADIAKTFADKIHIGFRIRFTPVDPTQDADGSVTITNDAGQRWTIPYSYRAHTVELTPAQIELLAVAVGAKQTIPLTLRNQKPFTTTVLDVRLRDGTQGFTLVGRQVLPKPLASGGSFGLTLEFVGAEAGKLYVDTLVIEADCDSMLVPLSARTAPPLPRAVPLISGYDWGVRRVGSVNDTLSFISNAGTLPFTTDRVEILNDPAGAFALVAPDYASLPPIAPAAREPIGIRFAPPAEGMFVSDILLITTDGDSARATLRGSSLLARIDVDDVALPALCAGQPLDTMVDIRISGSAPARIDSFVVVATNARVVLDTSWIGLPRTLAPGESLRLRMSVIGIAAGAFDASVVAVGDATGDSVARITGSVVVCQTPGLRATDLDFGDVLVTRTRAGSVYVVNTGQGAVTVTAMRIVDDADGSFRVLAPPPPFVVPEGDSVTVDVDFTPPTRGPKSARVEYTTSAGVAYSLLRGVGVELVIPAHIPRTYHGQPGTRRDVAVILDSAIDVRGATAIPVVVGYDPALLDFVALVDTARTQLVLAPGAVAPGSVGFELRPSGDSLAVGPIAALRFLVRIAVEDSTELPLRITSPLPWLTFATSPGLFVRDPWCGLTERLFEFTAGSLALAPVRPNPVHGDAIVELAVPFDAEASLVVIDALGVERLHLVDGALGAGAHTVTIPAGSLATGVYLVRLRVGASERVARFVVE